MFVSETTKGIKVRLMVFSTTFNNISVISWQSCSEYQFSFLKYTNYIVHAQHSYKIQTDQSKILY